MEMESGYMVEMESGHIGDSGHLVEMEPGH